PLLKPENPRAAHRKEDGKQRQHRCEKVEKTEEVQPTPYGPYQEPERDAPQPGPEERSVNVRLSQGDRLVDPEGRAKAQRKQDVAEKDHGQSAQDPRRE